jgi:hypothetical protein
LEAFHAIDTEVQGGSTLAWVQWTWSPFSLSLVWEWKSAEQWPEVRESSELLFLIWNCFYKSKELVTIYSLLNCLGKEDLEEFYQQQAFVVCSGTVSLWLILLLSMPWHYRILNAVRCGKKKKIISNFVSDKFKIDREETMVVSNESLGLFGAEWWHALPICVLFSWAGVMMRLRNRLNVNSFPFSSGFFSPRTTLSKIFCRANLSHAWFQPLG